MHMNILKLKSLSQRGDTIVEVLIAMSIISLVLAAAYVTSTRNTTLMQGSQERQQAQRLVESQIEMVRSQGGLNASGDCFIAGVERSPADIGAPCSTVKSTYSGATYTLSITGPLGTANPTGTYTVSAVWTSLGSKKTNDSSITMYYRLN
jgi:prepilin-type N-terminal cleavage/methylation domain-containing protein